MNIPQVGKYPYQSLLKQNLISNVLMIVPKFCNSLILTNYLIKFKINYQKRFKWNQNPGIIHMNEKLYLQFVFLLFSAVIIFCNEYTMRFLIHLKNAG